MNATARIIVMAILFCAAPFPAQAGIDAWRKIALDKTHIISLVNDPAWPSTILYATTPQGLLKSLDGGNTWNRIGETLPQGIPPSVITIAPCSHLEVYVGYDGLGVFKSDDGGQTWQPMNEGLPGLSVHTIAVNCINPNNVYMGTRDGLAISNSGGRFWHMHTGFKPSINVSAIAPDPHYPQIIYVGTEGAGIFKSGNGGVTWRAFNEGLDGLNITTLYIDPNNPAIVLAGVHHPATQADAHSGESGGGVFRSTNRGNTWHRSSLLNSRIFSFTGDPAYPNVVYASTDDGIYRSVDSGLSWTSINAGLDTIFPHTILFLPANPPVLLAGTTSGLFSYTDTTVEMQEQGSDSSTTIIAFGLGGVAALGLLSAFLWLRRRRKDNTPDSQQPVW